MREVQLVCPREGRRRRASPDRKSTRLNSSHTVISYAVFCLKKKKQQATQPNHAAADPTKHRLITATPPNSALPIPRTTLCFSASLFFFNDTATPEIYTLSLHDALPICAGVTA